MVLQLVLASASAVLLAVLNAMWGEASDARMRSEDER